LKKPLLYGIAVLASAIIVGSLLAFSSSNQVAGQAETNASQDPAIAFLKLEGIDGESQDANHTGWIDIEAFHWGLNHTASKGIAFGRPVIEDFCFETRVSKASPKLFLASANGKHFNWAVLSVTGKTSSDGQVQTFFNITMNSVVITSYEITLSGQNELPTDHFCLDFGQITMDYIIYGAPGGPQHVTATWDQVKNLGV